jgi:hypothetical protein
VRPVRTLPGVRAAWAYYRVARSLWLHRRLGYTWRPAVAQVRTEQLRGLTPYGWRAFDRLADVLGDDGMTWRGRRRVARRYHRDVSQDRRRR